MSDYWEECISEALEAEGVAATDAQIAAVAKWIAGAHECYGMAHGHDVVAKNYSAEKDDEIKTLRRKLDDEASKVPCPTCEGRWEPTLNGNIEPARYTCYKCNGSGKVAPHLGRH